MILTFDDVWRFLERTAVRNDILDVISPDGGIKLNPNDVPYMYETHWELRFDMNYLRNLWEHGCTFAVKSSMVTPELREIVEEIERDNGVRAQAHVYFGKVGSRSFNPHADISDNFIIQCIGKSQVTIYNEYSGKQGIVPNSAREDMTVKEKFIFEPGNTVFIPKLQCHLFEPLTDRLSISIPMQ